MKNTTSAADENMQSVTYWVGHALVVKVAKMIALAKKHVQIHASALCVVSVKGGWGGLGLGSVCCKLGMPGTFLF